MTGFGLSDARRYGACGRFIAPTTSLLSGPHVTNTDRLVAGTALLRTASNSLYEVTCDSDGRFWLAGRNVPNPDSVACAATDRWEILPCGSGRPRLGSWWS